MKKNKKSKTKLNPPPWQELNIFLLSKIFTFLSPHDQLFITPYVCTSWLHATLHTLFPNSTLPLSPLDTLPQIQRPRFTHLLKLAVDRIDGWISISFPSKHPLPYLLAMHIAERTSNISSVFLPSYPSSSLCQAFLSLLYWKNLRVFRGPTDKLPPSKGYLLLAQLVDHCKGVVDLGFHGEVMEREVVSIVEGVPLIKVLDISGSRVWGKGLKVLLDGRLKFLRELNVMHCLFVGDDGDDDVINDDYEKMKGFKEEVFEKVSRLKGLKKFLHCFGKNCQQCKDGIKPVTS
ncbi:hypothetical protein LguiB_002865 [Lonicera macranthoides]